MDITWMFQEFSPAIKAGLLCIKPTECITESKSFVWGTWEREYYPIQNQKFLVTGFVLAQDNVKPTNHL